MAKSPLIDVHMHIYETKRSGEWQKASYEIWEYGPGRPPCSSAVPAVTSRMPSGRWPAAGYRLCGQREPVRGGADPGRGDRRAAAGADIGRPAARAGRDRGHHAGAPPRLQPVGVRRGRAERPDPPVRRAGPLGPDPEENAAHLRELAERHGARGVKLHPVVQRFAPERSSARAELSDLRRDGAGGARPFGDGEGIAAVRGAPGVRRPRAEPGRTSSSILAHLGGGSLAPDAGAGPRLSAAHGSTAARSSSGRARRTPHRRGAGAADPRHREPPGHARHRLPLVRPRTAPSSG